MRSSSGIPCAAAASATVSPLLIAQPTHPIPNFANIAPESGFSCSTSRIVESLDSAMFYMLPEFMDKSIGTLLVHIEIDYSEKTHSIL